MFESFYDLIKTRDTIFIDTCSLLSGGFAKFYEQNRRFLLSEHKSVTIPLGVIHELERFESEDSERGVRSKSILKLIQNNEYGLFSIMETDLRPDDLFLSYCAANRSTERVLIITQDYMLCRSIARLNEERTGFYNKTIFVKRVSYDGVLTNFDMTKVPSLFNNRSNKTNAGVLLATLMK